MYETTLSSKRQIVLPAKACDEKNVLPGARFKVFPTPHGFELVEMPKDPLKALVGLTAGLGVKSSDIKKMRREDDRRREKKLGI